MSKVILSQIGQLENDLYIQCGCLLNCSFLRINKFECFDEVSFHFDILSESKNKLIDCFANKEDMMQLEYVMKKVSMARDEYSLSLLTESGWFIELTKVGHIRDHGIMTIEFYKTERRYIKEKTSGGLVIDLKNVSKIRSAIRELVEDKECQK